MKYEVLKGLTFAGQDLKRGDTVEIPEDSSKIGSLVRARFIRFSGEPGEVVPAAPPQPSVKTAARPKSKAKV